MDIFSGFSMLTVIDRNLRKYKNDNPEKTGYPCFINTEACKLIETGPDWVYISKTVTLFLSSGRDEERQIHYMLKASEIKLFSDES